MYVKTHWTIITRLNLLDPKLQWNKKWGVSETWEVLHFWINIWSGMVSQGASGWKEQTWFHLTENEGRPYGKMAARPREPGQELRWTTKGPEVVRKEAVQICCLLSASPSRTTLHFAAQLLFPWPAHSSDKAAPIPAFPNFLSLSTQQ